MQSGECLTKIQRTQFGDRETAFMQNFKKGIFTNSIDPDETPHDAASHLSLRYLPCLAHSC